MDASNDEDTETFDSVTRLTASDENKDFISDLPDEILVHILSFLPLKDAINTLLVRRFGNLWRSITVLDIDYCLYHDCEDDMFNMDEYYYKKFMSIVQHVLNLHANGTLEKLFLNFYFARRRSVDYVEKYTAEQIEKLISYAISKNIKILDLNLKGCFPFLYPYNRYDLSNVFACRHLTDLYLTACDLRSCVAIDLKLLKVLFLCQVSLSDDIMENILIGCPFLETLSVDCCFGLNILICKNPNLKKVRLNTREDLLSVSCPHVLSFEIDGCIENIYVLDVSSVVDASISSYFYRCENRSYNNVSSLFQKVCKSKTLKLCTWSILVLSIQSLTDVPCPSFFCKNLTLGFGLTKWHFPGLALLLRSSPSMEALTINFTLLNESYFTTRAANWILSHDFDGDSYWDSQEVILLPHLEIILIYGYRSEPCMIEVVKFLLRSSPSLHKMVITTKKNFQIETESEFTSQELKELSQKLLRVPRASSQAVICVS